MFGGTKELQNSPTPSCLSSSGNEEPCVWSCRAGSGLTVLIWLPRSSDGDSADCETVSVQTESLGLHSGTKQWMKLLMFFGLLPDVGRWIQMVDGDKRL